MAVEFATAACEATQYQWLWGLRALTLVYARAGQADAARWADQWAAGLERAGVWR